MIMVEFSEYTGIARLLSRLMTGSLTEEEMVRLEAWKSADERNARLYSEIMGGTFLKTESDRLAETEIVSAYHAVVRKRVRRARMHLIKKISTIAAVVLLPLGLSLFLVQNTDREEVVVQSSEIRPGETMAELQLADGSTVWLTPGVKNSTLNEVGADIVTDDKMISYRGNMLSNEVGYNTLKVPRGGEFKVVLEDGTEVFLNSDSELKYPVRFVGNERRVYLSGEAYFEVKKNKEKPFFVELNSSVIEVTGTSFNVRSYRDESDIKTTLVEGEVNFLSATKESVTLFPGEQGTLNKAGQLSKQVVDTYLYTAWKDGVFVFKQERLEDIMNVVARWYDVNVFFANESQKEVTFSGRVRRYGDFNKIIEMIEMTGGNTRFEIKNKTVLVKETRD